MGVEWLDARPPRSPPPPSLSPAARAIPLQLLCITVSVGYRRQTASAVHHVVNVRRFLSYLSSLSLFSLLSFSLSFLSRKRACSRASLPFQFLLCLRSVFVVVVLRFSAFFPSLSPTVFARRMSSNRLKLKLLLSRSNVAHRRGMILISLINRYPSGEYSNLKSFDFFSLRFSFFFLSLSPS